MKLVALALALAATFALSACCTGIKTTTHPAKSCCASGGSCSN